MFKHLRTLLKHRMGIYQHEKLVNEGAWKVGKLVQRAF